MSPYRTFDWVEGYNGLPPAAVGDQMEKMGRTTGWTTGTVADLCVTIGDKDDPNLFAYCMIWVKFALAKPGDSGGSVFSSRGAPNGNAALYDVLSSEVVRTFPDGSFVDEGFVYTSMMKLRSALSLTVDEYLYCYC